MTVPDSQIARDWFAVKPAQVRGQLEFGDVEGAAPGTPSMEPAPPRPLTAREVVQRYLHTTSTEVRDASKTRRGGR